MEEAYLDDGPAVNFERATLEIAKDADGQELSQTSNKTSGNAASENAENAERASRKAPYPQDVSNVPFKHVDIDTFFSSRQEVIERALKDCEKHFLLDNGEDDLVGSWLLTEISLWDTEKERLVLLTKKFLVSVKYDFISLKILESSKIQLAEVDTVVMGELVYPPSSLAPRLNGIAKGVSSVIQCTIHQQWSSLTSCTGLTQFEPRKRHMSGIRIMWNRKQPLPLNKKWNPFAKDIPWLTYASHPLFWYKGSEMDKARFDVRGLHTSIVDLLNEKCNIVDGPIVIENYFGLGALLHNRNSLGFFKIRGKVSF